MDFDVLIVGGGAAGMSCALVIGSAMNKPFAEGKKAGIILHQKASHLQSALFNNVLGLEPGTTGNSILKRGKEQLQNLYPEVSLIEREKVKEISALPAEGFEVLTNKKTYTAKEVVVAVGYEAPMRIKGLEDYIVPHQRAKISKNRIQLKNDDHLVAPGLYVAGALAGWRSQYSIACGSGASVATDILTRWNHGEHVKVHDKLV
ncbi:FAD-dependent oxidoreductase [Zunongwangia sp. F363]|uniref:FAD-dependent oxidoreductase n=1 Tax=Autumnicola tepida TaxID=3075595 RepID=A0ABU3C7F6_9FLAO|nr:FAD-dependent oxidoreductase [Zunongwangia sp. F363]MDT0642257.1 FAD-dependent oxidoreductase [Zunongwangia sp. F363]